MVTLISSKVAKEIVADALNTLGIPMDNQKWFTYSHMIIKRVGDPTLVIEDYVVSEKTSVYANSNVFSQPKNFYEIKSIVAINEKTNPFNGEIPLVKTNRKYNLKKNEFSTDYNRIYTNDSVNYLRITGSNYASDSENNYLIRNTPNMINLVASFVIAHILKLQPPGRVNQEQIRNYEVEYYFETGAVISSINTEDLIETKASDYLNNIPYGHY